MSDTCTCGHVYDEHDGACLVEFSDGGRCPCVHFEAADDDD